MNKLLNQRRQWFSKYNSNLENKGVVLAQKADALYPCPCCGYPTLTERGIYEICELCNWEDDGQDDPDADEVWGGPNRHYSLTNARQNFARFLIMYDPEDDHPRIGGNKNSELEYQAKRAIVGAFEAMTVETNKTQIENLLLIIQKNQQVLKDETHRKVKEYEAKWHLE